MRFPRLPWSEILAAVAMAAGVGLLLILLSAIFQWRPLADLGGALLTPGLALAGGACALVVLLAPIWPITSMAEKVPTWGRWPFAAAAALSTLAWWWMWASIALGDHSGW